jgi:hypothetical protein
MTIELTRYRALILAGAAVVAATAGVDLAMTGLVGPASRWLPHGDYPADRGIIASSGRKLVAAGRSLRADGADPSTTLGLLLGQSTLECGVDPAALDADDGLAIRWLNLFGEGGSIHKIADIADLALASGLKPAAVVLAINPYFLVGNDYDVMRAVEAETTRNRVKPWVWTWDNRVLANHLVQVATHDARVRLARGLGLGLDALFAPEPRPWETETLRRPHRPADELESRLAYNRRIGWLDPRRYGTSTSNAEALARLIRAFRSLGARVVIVEMPLRSTFRRALPPEARLAVEAVARDADPGHPVPIIDLEDEVSDDLFLDLDHLDPDGRVACTRLLADRLREALGRSK